MEYILDRVQSTAMCGECFFGVSLLIHFLLTLFFVLLLPAPPTLVLSLSFLLAVLPFLFSFASGSALCSFQIRSFFYVQTMTEVFVQWNLLEFKTSNWTTHLLESLTQVQIVTRSLSPSKHSSFFASSRRVLSRFRHSVSMPFAVYCSFCRSLSVTHAFFFFWCCKMNYCLHNKLSIVTYIRFAADLHYIFTSRKLQWHFCCVNKCWQVGKPSVQRYKRNTRTPARSSAHQAPNKFSFLFSSSLITWAEV